MRVRMPGQANQRQAHRARGSGKSLMSISAALLAFSIATSHSIAIAGTGEQQYPSKPVRIVVGYAPGGSNDIVARLFAQKLTQSWGTSVVVDNRPGATGNIAAELTARAQPDGHTLHLIGANNTINAAIAPPSYDLLKDFEHVVLAVSVPLILVVSPSINVNTVSELITLARAKPRQLNYASSGTGSISHMAAELFKTLTKTEITHVPYKGSAPGEADLVAGRVHVLFTGLAHTMPMIRAGRLRGLAVTSAQRVASAPDIPTVQEAGIPSYESSTWYGVVVPARTPAVVVTRINKDMNATLGMADVREALAKQGLEPRGGSAKEFAAHVRAELSKWARVVKDAGVKLEP